MFIAGPKLEPYVQDALDEIEYVTGDASTKWGAQRAKDGHPAPFELNYVEIGNEDGADKSHSYQTPIRAILRRDQGEVSESANHRHLRAEVLGWLYGKSRTHAGFD